MSQISMEPSLPVAATRSIGLVADSTARDDRIVSGLYELFPSNDAVLNSLRGLAEAIEPGGYLIYTNQPWHPQLDSSRMFSQSRRRALGHAVVARPPKWTSSVRSVASERPDGDRPWGMFTVSVAAQGDRALRRDG